MRMLCCVHAVALKIKNLKKTRCPPISPTACHVMLDALVVSYHRTCSVQAALYVCRRITIIINITWVYYFIFYRRKNLTHASRGFLEGAAGTRDS